MTKKTVDRQGYIKIWRKIWKNPIGEKPNYFAIFIYIVSHANYKDKDIIWNNKKITIKRGSFIGSLSKIAKHFKISKGTVHYVLEYLKAERMVERKATGSFTHFKVINYDDYQQAERLSENELNTSKTRVETTNKDKKDKNIKNKSIKEGKPSDKINSLISAFKAVNPSYERLYPNKTQREALERLVKKFGVEKIQRAVEVLPKVIHKTYAPQITTPYQLEQKLGALLSFLKRERNEEDERKKEFVIVPGAE